MGEGRPNDKRRHDSVIVGLRSRVRELEQQLEAAEKNAKRFHALMLQARVALIEKKEGTAA